MKSLCKWFHVGGRRPLVPPPTSVGSFKVMYMVLVGTFFLFSISYLCRFIQSMKKHQWIRADVPYFEGWLWLLKMHDRWFVTWTQTRFSHLCSLLSVEELIKIECTRIQILRWLLCLMNTVSSENVTITFSTWVGMQVLGKGILTSLEHIIILAPLRSQLKS